VDRGTSIFTFEEQFDQKFLKKTETSGSTIPADFGLMLPDEIGRLDKLTSGVWPLDLGLGKRNGVKLTNCSERPTKNPILFKQSSTILCCSCSLGNETNFALNQSTYLAFDSFVKGTEAKFENPTHLGERTPAVTKTSLLSNHLNRSSRKSNKHPMHSSSRHKEQNGLQSTP
jgi:hypothetical protein